MFNYGLLIIGLYLIINSLIIKTKNLKSSFLFKVIPNICGLYLIFMFLLSQGYITI